MKTNDFAFYRKLIHQTQEKIAEILNVPLDVYIEFEENKREPSQRVKEAFYSLLERFPGSTALSRIKIPAIDKYKADYLFKTGKQPVGKHWIPFSFATNKRALVDFTPYDDDLNKGKIKTEKEMWDWINAHDITTTITPEYFNHLTTLNNRELEEEVDFWDRFYTARHYGKYQSRTTPKELEEQIAKKKARTREYWIDKANRVLIKALLGLIALWGVAHLIVFLDK
jgi:transcriptional regulator with XRE-family HTH domain